MKYDPEVLRLVANGRAIAAEKPATVHIPYTRFHRNGVIATRDNAVMTIFRLAGVAHEMADPHRLEAANQAVADLMVQFDDGCTVIYMHTIRRRSDLASTLTPVPGEDFAAALDEFHRDGLARRETYVVEHFLTVLRRPPLTGVGLVDGLLDAMRRKRSTGEARAARARSIETLGMQAMIVEEMLAPFGVRRLGGSAADRRTAVAFLSMLQSGIWMTAPEVPELEERLATAIPLGRVSFFGETVHSFAPDPNLNRQAAVLAISQYGPKTYDGMFDGLLGERLEFIMTQSFAPLDRVAGGRKIADAHRKMKDAGDEAKTDLAELVEAQDLVASRRMAMGNHHFTVSVLADDADGLSAAVPRAIAALSSTGFRVKREDMGMELAWWAQLPGNMRYQVRSGSRFTSNRNIAEMSAFHTHPLGARENLRWGGPITMFPTLSGTPYFFSFHEPGDNTPGSTAVFGAAGAGKTAMVNFILAQTRRLPTPPDIIYFDKDRGSEPFIRALGGEYMRLSPGENLGFNPFEIAVGMDGAEWLGQLIRRLTTIETLTPEQERRIAEAARRNANAPVERRSFRHFMDLLRSVDDGDSRITLRDGLHAWGPNGDRGWLFANERDSFSLDRSVIGFDIAGILDHPAIRSAILDYLFHRIERKLTAGRPTVIVLDEAWKLLDDARFQSRIKDWIKTIRKMNGLVVFMTQEPADAMKSAIAETLVQSTDNKLFFPNPAADEKSYIDGFGLSRSEFAAVRTNAGSMRGLLVKNRRESVLVSTRFSGGERFLKVLSGTAESVREMDRLRATHGDRWLGPFMEDARGFIRSVA